MMYNIATILRSLSALGIDVSLTLWMGADLDVIISSLINQPMAEILYDSLGMRRALALWYFVILAQYDLPACDASTD
ncbi:uncharacterized protein EDB93DRAFT_772993 [Suillus bovinus]|uniref:uncharacterized protein n=1 Tax=Suillus bovinus TaxID=48563 RepID=UPI001B87D6A7|nr:uncharacterized protein EDB93DRAFT_772993 [Suillus bovinus]KAG2136970.1 hypothetical protein EDB93DRAFT_772993 [Suillus bovinus]